MLNAYINAAMHLATYEFLEDQTYFGTIPGMDGLWSNASTLEACRDELKERLEEWIVISLRLGHELPVIDGINLTVPLKEEGVA